MNKKALIEAGKELLRIILIAVIPILYASINTETGDISINTKVLGAVVIVAVIRAVDKFIHKSDNELTGLLPF